MAKWGGRAATEATALTLAEYGTVCHLCRRPGADTADHLIPRASGGTDALDNLRPAHKSCNSARGDRSLAEWFRRHPVVPASARAAPSRVWTANARRLDDAAALGPAPPTR